MSYLGATMQAGNADAIVVSYHSILSLRSICRTDAVKETVFSMSLFIYNEFTHEYIVYKIYQICC